MQKIILTVFLLFCFTIQAQDTDFRNQRKGKLFFNVGTEYRITPITSLPTNVGYNPRSRSTNSDAQNTGVAFYYGLKMFITKNLSLGFSHSVRYTLLNNSSASDIPAEFGYKESVYRPMMGFYIYLDYHVKVFKEAELFARVGRSIINANSSYVYKESFYNNNDEFTGSFVSESNYRMFTTNFAIGLKKNKFEALIGVHTTQDPPYFTESVLYIIPYFNLNYTIGKLF
ncbi:MAG: hypothetical protein L3J09_07385 [Flavobacteriaceae bacterium]|nr:hypothetical protein [Flavobacteriaceae bacterium]